MKSFLIVFFLLVAVLAIMFHQTLFDPRLVNFSNDGPLGFETTYWQRCFPEGRTLLGYIVYSMPLLFLGLMIAAFARKP